MDTQNEHEAEMEQWRAEEDGMASEWGAIKESWSAVLAETNRLGKLLEDFNKSSV